MRKGGKGKGEKDNGWCVLDVEGDGRLWNSAALKRYDSVLPQPSAGRTESFIM